MHEEEKELKKWRAEIEKNEIPDDLLKSAIMSGVERGKKKKAVKKRRTRKLGMWTAVIAALLLLSFAATIRVSPAFANAVASIPGMSVIVDMIQDNKGLQLAVENEHYQSIGASGESEHVQVMLEGIITDESDLVAFSTIKTQRLSKNLFVDELVILDEEGNELNMNNSSQTSWDDEQEYVGKNMADFKFSAELPKGKLFLEYRMHEDGDDKVIETIRVPFEIHLQPIKKEQYVLNETAVVEGQKIHIRSVTVGSLKTAVEVEFDKANSMKIFGFENLRLVDGNGEVWSSITNGVTASGTDDPNVNIYYLQSNYFKETDHLTLQFNKLMALDKDQAVFVLDTEKTKIIRQPNEERFSILSVNGNFITIEMKGQKGYYHDPFSTVHDDNNKELDIRSSSFYRGENNFGIGIELTEESFQNPITLPLVSYPSYINGEVKMQVK